MDGVTKSLKPSLMMSQKNEHYGKSSKSYAKTAKIPFCGPKISSDKFGEIFTCQIIDIFVEC